MLTSIISGLLVLLSYFYSISKLRKADKADLLEGQLDTANKRLELTKEQQAVIATKEVEMGRKLSEKEMVDFLKNL
jgi:hypothetical protein